MSYCVSCGVPIPAGQKTCSMCYGDPYHGTDGYYMDLLEEERAAEEYAQRSEQDRQGEALPLMDRLKRDEQRDIPY
jgi:hypothetical protein